MKYLLYLMILITTGCSVQNNNSGNRNYPKPNLIEAFQRLDQFMIDVPLDEFAKTPFRSSSIGSSVKTNEEAETVQERTPACYVVQYHYNPKDEILIVNYVFYTNNTTIQSHSIRKFKLTPLNMNKVTFEKVNDNYSTLPPSFYTGFTIYGATPLYSKCEEFGKEPFISTGTYNPTNPSFHEYFAIKNTGTSFSAMQFPWNIDYDTGHITLLYNSMENSISVHLDKFGTTPSQAANIKFGTLDIPHI